MGEAIAEKNSEITFIKKVTCSNAELVNGRQYLIMGKEALQIKYNFSFSVCEPFPGKADTEEFGDNLTPGDLITAGLL
ncbi:hypothetical protein P7K49_001632 [Saguinus oedipus]|uniref:Netrin module non-TIMP type domain-containing protein n=1 Tax=Saguinus oedipus TaxID=9490 RepID=A0ABQ9WG36_SAGOE|nr:hypothetical protein P7K49_001632 [Saguinus oedipus]